MKVALIGYGYWGTNIARTIHECGLELKYIYDIDPCRIEKAKRLYHFRKSKDVREILNSDVAAVFIATPPSMHYVAAKEFLLAGKHVFVEKPFTTSVETAHELFEIAERNKLIAFADHVFTYAEPVKKLKELMNAGEFGEIVYINSRRINLGLFQYTVDVIWDLAVHDLSIIEYLVGLDCKQISVFKKRYNDFPNSAIANIHMELTNGTIVSISVSWLSPVKVREMIIGGTKMMAVYNDTKENKLRLFDRGVVLHENLDRDALYEHMVQYKYGNIVEPELPKKPALTNSVDHFIECIKEGKQPLVGRDSVINVTRVLETISRCGQ